MLKQWQLQQRLSLPLDVKIIMTKLRIIKWYEHFEGDVYISFSGGKDSTVLLHLVRSIYPDIGAVFCDTGLEYPEVRCHVKSIKNVTWIKPKISFKEVLNKWGFPIISKETSEKIYKYKNHNLSEKFRKYLLHGNEFGRFGMIPKKWQFLLNENIKISSKCCDIMKKRPFKYFEKRTGKKPFIGTMAGESKLRKQKYLQNGCNSFKSNKQVSNPLSFWTEQDILKYIKLNNLNIPSVYGEIYKENELLKLTGVKRTGCVFCCYGVHMEKYPNRFQILEKTHKKLWNYCIYDLDFKKVLNLINVPYKFNKVNKNKYKLATIKLSVRIAENKFNILKKIYVNLKNSEIFDLIIDDFYKKIDKRKKPNGAKEIMKISKAKYKINTIKICIIVDESKFNLIKLYSNKNSNTQVIDFLIDNKLKSIGHFSNIKSS
jgi:3'-phosphoadenosine 5'-phosphosulfate sulfotransferase (PAPS reductase)/FAD synthetase